MKSFIDRSKEWGIPIGKYRIDIRAKVQKSLHSIYKLISYRKQQGRRKTSWSNDGTSRVPV